MSEFKHHYIHRMSWLRAAVLGANDGIVSTASLILGVAAAQMAHRNILLTGLASLVAGAISMAAGEYVSVSSQADTEKADLRMEKQSLKHNTAVELQELTDIYIERGLETTLAQEVARQLMDKDALEAHARDELGIFDHNRARPMQAALSSGAAFTVGAILPLGITWLLPVSASSSHFLSTAVAASSLFFLAGLGALAASIGGGSMIKGALRVGLWGAFAMALTAGVGSLFGVNGI